MSAVRPLPWTALMEAIGTVRFAEVRAALAAAGTDDLDRDAFLLNAAVGGLLRDLMPTDEPAEAVHAWGALLHALHVSWARDWPVARPDTAALRAALGAGAPLPARTPPAAVCYVQLPERLVWSEGEADAPHEPVDGMFVIAWPDRVHVLAVLGFRSEREGFTTAEGALRLPAPAPAPRSDGSAPFTTRLPGGDRAGLLAVADQPELAALAVLALDAASG